MSTSHKSPSIQMFRMMLYSRPLHPELFALETRRIDRHGEYEVETWITPGGHVVRFSLPEQVLTETVLEHGDHLPETGLVHVLPCFGEKDFETDPTQRLKYYTTIQTEQLSDNLYQATLREMQDFARETGSLVHGWKDGDGVECLSMVDGQKYRKEYHFQTYHLLGVTGTVLRTQSIFEIIK